MISASVYGSLQALSRDKEMMTAYTAIFLSMNYLMKMNTNLAQLISYKKSGAKTH